MENERPPLISLVVPLYKEAAYLRAFLSSVTAELGKTGCRYELIVVDDGSPDDTWNILSEEATGLSQLRALRLSRNFGKELALCAGLEHARGDAIIIMDGDGQHPPSLSGRMGALLFYVMLNRLAGVNLKGVSDFKLMNRKAVNAWLEMPERNVFFRGMTAWLGFTHVQVPFEVPGRAEGSTSWSFPTRLKLALTGISAFSSLPLQFVTIAGLLFFAFSIFFGLYTLVLQLAGRSVSGFATVILLLLIIGSLLMLSLGIIGEYLARIYEEVKGRPRYVIASTIEPSSPSE